MADNTRQFTLIGSFTDNISKPLEAINKSLDGVLQKLERYHTIGLTIKNDFKEVGKAVRDLSADLRDQGAAATEAKNGLKAYTNQLGRVNRANRAGGYRFLTASGKVKAGQTVADAKAQAALAVAQARADQIRSRISNYGGGGGSRGPGISRVAGAAVGGTVIGDQLAGIVQTGIVSGFQLGVRLMEAPFKHFFNAWSERVEDEIQDLKAAGGYFAIAKRQKDPFVKNFDQALAFTQEQNKVLAKLAAALPGSTQDYIQVAKRVGDSIARVVANDTKNAIIEANKAISQNPQYYGGGPITGTDAKAQQRAILTLTAELTKKTVLAGFGGRTGAGGVAGPYGLSGLAERILSQDQVSVAQFQKYAAIFSDPSILDSLTRNVGKINASAKGSAERIKAFNVFIDEVLPPELVDKYRLSIAGITEAFKTAIGGPETGLFGIGRKFKEFGKQVNSYGQYIDEAGNVVHDMNQAASVDLSLFEILRDIFVNIAVVITPLVDILPAIYDPLKAIGLSLKDAREYAIAFHRNFEAFRQGFQQFAKLLPEAQALKILETADARAALETIGNLFERLGIITRKARLDTTTKLLDPNADLGAILKEFIQKFFSSDLARQIGFFIGNVVGTVLSEVAKATSFITNVTTSGGLAAGLNQGFSQAGGPGAIATIFGNIIRFFIKALAEIVRAAPFKTAILAAVAILPSLLGGFLTTMLTSCFSGLTGAAGGCGLPGFFGGGGGGKRAPGGGVTPSQRLAGLGYGKAPGRYTPAGFLRNARGAARGAAIGGAAFGVTDAILRVASGQGIGQAIGGAASVAIGSTLGGILGQTLIPIPGLGYALGSAVGAAAGGKIFDAAFDAFTKPAAAMTLAAEALKGQQKEQSEQQQRQAEAGVSTEFSFGTAEQFGQRLDVLGLAGDQALTGKISYGLLQKEIGEALAASNALTKEITSLTLAGYTPKQIEEKTKDLREAAAKEQKEALGAQKAFSTWLSSLPKTFQDQFARSFSKLSFKELEAIAAQKFANIQIKPPQFAFTLPTPDNTPPNQVDPNNVFDYNNPFDWSKLPPKPGKPGGSGWRRSSFGEGCSVSGGLGNKAAGSVDAFNSIARSKGLSLTSGYRPGSPGWHGVNRARDYSNGYAPTPQMMSFAKYMAENYGARLKELIYTPLGYSIKNGRKVPPYARAGHYNHVHVAYGLGFPTPFSSLEGARAFEKAVTPGSVKIASVTGRSDEGFGSTINVTNNISISQLPGQSADDLATLVALKISNEVNRQAWI